MAASPGRKKRSVAARPKPALAPGRVARDGGAREAASYIAEQVAELARLARRHKHDTLGFLLDMAHMEAVEIIRQRKK
jgi:hypothetical protein